MKIEEIQSRIELIQSEASNLLKQMEDSERVIKLNQSLIETLSTRVLILYGEYNALVNIRTSLEGERNVEKSESEGKKKPK